MHSFYEPLNSAAREIRLLQLLPAARPTDPIKCTLQTVSLSTKPTYIALSYFWGASEDRSLIYVNDIEFPATLNLCAALRRMRSDSEPGTFWADALCINQADNIEKSGQIPMMKDIYQEAAVVTVWLGEQSDHSEDVIRLMILTSVLYEKDKSVGHEARQVMMYALEQQAVLFALGSFLQRDWWSRVWVIQEIAVSQRALLLCGEKTISWGEFINAFLFWSVMLKEANRTNELSFQLQYLQRIIEGTSARTVVHQHRRLNGGDQDRMNSVYGLQEMLEESWNFDSTNPLDKIYAWIGLITGNDVTITPDYNETPARVYAGLVKSMMEQRGSTTLIAFTGSSSRENVIPLEGLPSWAPDLRRDAIGPPEKAPIWLYPKSFKASSNMSAVGSVSDDLKTLTVSAVKVGKVELIDASRDEKEGGELGDKLCRWLYLVLGQKSRLSSSMGPVHDALFRIIVLFYHSLHLGISLEAYENELIKLNHLRLGYMAYVGYNDRVQDYIIAQHAQASLDTSTYLLGTTTTTLPSGETKRTAFLGSATALLPEIVRPQSMTSIISGKDKTIQEPGLPPRPQMADLENFARFFELWDIDTNLKSNNCAYLRLYQQPFSQPLSNNIHRFIQQFASITKGKALFVTETGYLGLGLNAIQVGDYVCIIRGCSLPVVIREHAEEGYFEVVYQCYTWGTMYGEFVDSMQARNLEWETITFR